MSDASLSISFLMTILFLGFLQTCSSIPRTIVEGKTDGSDNFHNVIVSKIWRLEG